MINQACEITVLLHALRGAIVKLIAGGADKSQLPIR